MVQLTTTNMGKKHANFGGKVMLEFFKPKVKPIRESHVVVTNSETGDTMVHLWKGDAIQNGSCVRLDNNQAMKLRDELVKRFGV